MRGLHCILAAIALTAGSATGQSTTSPDAHAIASEDELTQELADAKTWSFSFSTYAYVVPDERNYLQPTFRADRDWLHLEARYNYEALDTGSIWLGYNFECGDELTFEFTPMLGGVFGDTDGIAPGFELTLAWRGFELYSEAEYVFDSHDSSDNFAYTWTELTYAPLDWLRAGVVIQRTRAYDNDLDIQRGLMVGVTFDQLDFTAYVFNPDDDDPIFVFGMSIEF